MDLLFSRGLAAKCSWTGIARDGIEKVAIRNQRNIVNLFKTIGTSPRERIDVKYVHHFFKTKFKSAKVRFLRHQGRLVSDDRTNSMGSIEEQAGFDADSSNAVGRPSMKSLDDESQLSFEVEVLP